jgi:hypothetical protein
MEKIPSDTIPMVRIPLFNISTDRALVGYHDAITLEVLL